MLAFEDIPVGARIVRAVELYAALLCDRPYRSALDEQQAVETLTASAGIECDPYVVKALLALLDELRAGLQQPVASGLANPPGVEALPDQLPLLERAIAVESPPVLTAPESSSDLLPAHPAS